MGSRKNVKCPAAVRAQKRLIPLAAENDVGVLSDMGIRVGDQYGKQSRSFLSSDSIL